MHSTPEPLTSLMANARRWSHDDFARRTGLDPEHAGTRKLFLKLQQVADGLTAFDPEVMAAICSPPPPPPPKDERR